MSLVQVLICILSVTWSNGLPLEGLADYSTSHVKADGSVVRISTYSGENALKTIDYINNDQRSLWQQSLWPWQNQFFNNYYRQPYYYNNYAQIPLSGSLWNYFINDWTLRPYSMPLVPPVSSYYNYGQQTPQYYPPNLVPAGQDQQGQFIPAGQGQGQFIPLPPQGNSGNFVSSSVSNQVTPDNPTGNFVTSIVSQNSNQAEPTIINYTGNSPNFVSSVVSNQGPLYPGYIPQQQSPVEISPALSPEVDDPEDKENDNEVEIEKDD